MRPWITARRWRCTWRRDIGPRHKSWPSFSKQFGYLSLHSEWGCGFASARDLGRVSRAASPLYLRIRVSGDDGLEFGISSGLIVGISVTQARFVFRRLLAWSPSEGPSPSRSALAIAHL